MRQDGRDDGGEWSQERRFWAVVPAGGAGTRLWPLSRARRPKFLLPLLGERSLLQRTVDRLAPLAPPERTLIVCGPGHAAEVARQLPAIPAQNIVIEPTPQGSGPAIALAAAIIAREEPRAMMGSFAADHVVRDEAAFRRGVGVAAEAAAGGWLSTLGLAPTRPETGFGYIERTDEAVVATAAGTAYRAARFVEKPDLEMATEYVASGRFLWNASMFVWRVDTLLGAVARLLPDLAGGLDQIAAAWDSQAEDRVVGAVWSGLTETTIDQGVLERASRVAVVPVDCGWSDVGDWHGLGELVEQDGVGNSIRGDLAQIDTTRTTVWAETDRLIGLVGLDNLVIVDTPDALLVADRTRAQDVRRLVEQLKRQDRRELT